MNNLKGWAPIETAPKDGTEVLVRFPLQGNVKQLVSWSRFRGYWKSKGEPLLGLVEQRAEWHPLPSDDATPPQAEGEGGDDLERGGDAA
jgi:hypothetical protein